MTSRVAEAACAFAWRNYLLIHKGMDEDDDRRSALNRYISNLSETGDHGFDELQVAAVMYLKELDEIGDDRAARLAADKALFH